METNSYYTGKFPDLHLEDKPDSSAGSNKERPFLTNKRRTKGVRPAYNGLTLFEKFQTRVTWYRSINKEEQGAYE